MPFRRRLPRRSLGEGGCPAPRITTSYCDFMAACLHQTSQSKHQTFPDRRLCVYGTRAPSRKRLYLSIVGRNMMINVIAATSLREEVAAMTFIIIFLPTILKYNLLRDGARVP